MANTYKDIVIIPYRGDAGNVPVIRFSSGDTTTNADMNVRFYATSNGSLSFEGTSGQMFSITNDMTGSIFSVNDISGIPSIDVNASGQIAMAHFGGNVGIGTANAIYKLDVAGDARITGNVILGDSSTDTITLNGTTITLGNNQSIDSGTLFIDAVNNEVGIGTTNPTSNLHVIGTANITSNLVVQGSDVFQTLTGANAAIGTGANTVGSAAFARGNTAQTIAIAAFTKANSFVFSDATSQTFVANGAQTIFTLNSSISQQNNSIVTINGLVQAPNTHYTISGSTLTFTSPPFSNSLVEARAIGPALVGGDPTPAYNLANAAYNRANTGVFNSRDINTNNTVTLNDYMIFANGNVDVTLIQASGNIGKQYVVTNIGVGSVTILPQVSETIRGYTSFIIGDQWSSVTLTSTGSVWVIS